MPDKKQIRPSANTTREKILTAALKLFMQHGFAGTSMGKLAKIAKVNQALIFHHFGNKEKLWQKVKVSIVEKIQPPPIHSNPESLIEFLTEAIEQRLYIYTHVPYLKKLMIWQKLEPTDRKKDLIGMLHEASPLEWKKIIEYLQEKKSLNSQLNSDLVLVWLIASIDALVEDNLVMFNGDTHKQDTYKKMLASMMCKSLTL